MWIPTFKLHRPKTLQEACKMAADLAPDFDFIAGGTDLLQNYKCRINVKSNVISLRHIGLLRERTTEWLGAGGVLGELLRDQKFCKTHPAIADTCDKIASPLILNTASLGGNLLQDTRCYHFNQSHWWRMAHGSCLKAEADICRVVPKPGNICYATYCGDLAPLLICQQAEVKLVSARGERVIALDKFFQMDGIKRFVKEQTEVLTGIRVPQVAQNFRSAYQKMRVRQSIDYPELGVAVALQLKGETLEYLRIAATAIAPVPVIYDQYTAKYIGRQLTQDLMQEIADEISNNSTPYRNTYLVPSYRRKMLGVLTKRLLHSLKQPSKQATSIA